MKKIMIILTCMMLLSACTGNPATINNITYKSVGLFENQNPNIHYELNWGSVFWGVIFFDTVIAPIYFFGFDLFDPICSKDKYIEGAGCQK